MQGQGKEGRVSFPVSGPQGNESFPKADRVSPGGIVSNGSNGGPPIPLANRFQRVAVLVDVQNMFYAARELHGGKLNYKRLLEFVLRGRTLARAVAYCVVSPDRDASPFLNYLEAVGYETRTKTLRRRADGTARANWNVGLTVDALAIAQKVDAVCLVTGDGDYAPLADALRSTGVFVEGFAFGEFAAAELVDSLHRFTKLDGWIIGPSIDRDRDADDGASRGQSFPDGGEGFDEVPTAEAPTPNAPSFSAGSDAARDHRDSREDEYRRRLYRDPGALHG
jgi:uncharacterized LabA/DUF88 family protein